MRSCSREYVTRPTGSSDIGPPLWVASTSAIWPRERWMTGARMCEGRSPASWMIHSPRSVSTGVRPAASSAGLSSISSETIDLPLAMTSTPRRRAISITARTRLAGVAAWMTLPPRLVTCCSKRASSSGARATASVRMARARSTRSAQSGWRSSTARAEPDQVAPRGPQRRRQARVAERLVDARAERLVAAVDDAHGAQPSRSSSSGSVVVVEPDVVLLGHAAEVHEAAEIARDELARARLVHRVDLVASHRRRDARGT